MYTLSELYADICLPTPVIDALSETELPFDSNTANRLAAALTEPDKYDSAYRTLSSYSGYVQLSVMLSAALRTREKYISMGIDLSIYRDTVRCFTRFICEHMESYGCYGFDRGFWTGRQLSCLLFRIGELEYELAELDGSPAISVHIPSDSNMTSSRLDASFAEARRFFSRYFPDHSGVPYFCHSWLMAPSLSHVLPDTSRIMMFQHRFRIVREDIDSLGYVKWVYRSGDLAPADFPEDTSLQRGIKRYVLSGGKIGEALGILK